MSHPDSLLIPDLLDAYHSGRRSVAAVLQSLLARAAADAEHHVWITRFSAEQVLRHARQEIPYCTAVLVDVFDETEREPRPGPRRGPLAGLVRIAATVYVARDSQKAILIGKGGQMLKRIGTDARKEIERLLGTHVYLSLRIKVEPDWSDRADGLRKLGYG